MLILLNGYPGVGKLTIGTELARQIDGKLVDAHTMYNLSFSLTEFKSVEFYQTIRDVRALAEREINKLPIEIPVIFTEVLKGGDPWVMESMSFYRALAEKRGGLFVIHLTCDLAENKRRIQSEGRASSRKPRDADIAERYHLNGYHLAGSDTEHFLKIDVTDLAPVEAASAIAKQLGGADGSS